MIFVNSAGAIMHQRFFLLEISRLARRVTGTASTEMRAAAPVVMLCLALFSELCSGLCSEMCSELFSGLYSELFSGLCSLMVVVLSERLGGSDDGCS